MADLRQLILLLTILALIASSYAFGYQRGKEEAPITQDCNSVRGDA